MIGTQVVTRSEFEAELRKLRLSVSGTGITALPPTSMLVKITRTLIAGAGLTGGGDLSADRTFAVGAGTGIAVGADAVSLSHLGLEALTNPGADRIFFWDNSEVASKWLTCGDSIVITTTTLDTIQDIRTSATPTFAGLYLKSSSAAPFLKLTNESDTERDPIIQFAVGATPVIKFTMGVDDSDSDVFKLSTGSALGTTDLIKVTNTYTEIYNTLYAGFVNPGFPSDTEVTLVGYSSEDEENRAMLEIRPSSIILTAQDLDAAPGTSNIEFTSSIINFSAISVSFNITSPVINLLDNSELRFYEAVSAPPYNYVGIKAPVIVTTAYTLTLPAVTAGAKKHLFSGATDILDWGQNVDTDGSPTFVALNLSATSNQIILQSAGVTGTITATPATSNKVWTLQNVTGTIYQTGGTDVAVADGGTNKSSWTLYAIPYASGTTTIGEIAIGSAGQVLAVNVGADGYTWAAALSNPMNAVGDIIVGGVAGAPEKLADVAVGSYLRSGGVVTAPLWSTLTLPNTGTAYRLPVFSATNVMTELVAVGATGEYLAGATGAIPAWATLNQAAVVGLTTAEGPTFDHVHLTATSYCGGNLIFSGAATKVIQHAVDDQAIYVNAGSGYTKGASIQFYGEDHASFPGDAYIVAGSSDRAALGSIVELAFRDAGTYRKLLTLTYAATPVGLLTGSFQCTTGFGCNSKTAQTAYASGGAVAPGAGAYGYSSAVNAAALATLVTNIRLALVANGIMS